MSGAKTVSLPYAITQVSQEEQSAYGSTVKLAGLVIEGGEVRIGQAANGALMLQATFPLPPVFAVPRLSMSPVGPIGDMARKIKGGKMRLIVQRDALTPEIGAQLDAMEEALANSQMLAPTLNPLPPAVEE